MFDWPSATVLLGTLATVAVAIFKWSPRESVPAEHDKALADEIRELEGADTELAHSEADKILLKIAALHGYTRTAGAFTKLTKWYA
jgi:hypothetical protein